MRRKDAWHFMPEDELVTLCRRFSLYVSDRPRAFDTINADEACNTCRRIVYVLEQERAG